MLNNYVRSADIGGEGNLEPTTGLNFRLQNYCFNELRVFQFLISKLVAVSKTLYFITRLERWLFCILIDCPSFDIKLELSLERGNVHNDDMKSTIILLLIK